MLEVSKDTFSQEVLESEQDVIVDFWAPWCGPCRMMTPIVEDAEKANKKVKFVSVNIDEEPGLADAYDVKSIPSFVAFRDGEVKGRFMGAYPPPAFQAHMLNALG